MSHEISADHSQIFLFPPVLEDWVGPDDPVRFIRMFVDQLDLEELGFSSRKRSDCGPPNYDAKMLLGIWLYGYYNKLRSSRKLEAACRKELPLVWLTGMNYPDHNTLWRFWSRYRKELGNIFKETVRVAQKLDMIGMVLNAVDGTKFFSVSSSKTMWNQTKFSNQLKELDALIKEIEAQIEQKYGEEKSTAHGFLPERLQSKQSLREAICSSLDYLKEMDIKSQHPLETEARVMKNQQQFGLGYNGQAMVDDKSQVIVAAELTNEENDWHQLKPMLEKTQENTGKNAEETLADSGYDNPDHIRLAEEAEMSVLINEQQIEAAKNPYNQSHFRYDPDLDVVVCPHHNDEKLTYVRNKKKDGKETDIRVYRCGSQNCPFMKQCKGKTKANQAGRSIGIGPNRLYIEAQNRKRRTPKAAKILSRRKAIVEPVFAHIKIQDGFTRFTYRGIEKARTQWRMVCTAYNLRKIFKNPVWLRLALN